MKLKILVFSLLLVTFLLGCVRQSEKSYVEQVKMSCINLCKKALDAGRNLENGPCLSDNNPEWEYDDWVCDVAHWPRQSVDNLPENQCQAYRQGLAHHFVEVDTNCNYIRHY